jgi:hypothetical protein
MIPPIKTKSFQDYGTPPEAIQPLIPYLKKFKKLWDPLTGPDNSNLALANTLKEYGFEVFTSSKSFFHFFAPPKGVEAIVTNPPYTDTECYISYAFDLGIPFCFLIPITKLSNKTMYSMLKQHSFEVLILPGRLNYVGGKNSAPFPSCWLCSNVLPEKLVLV